ncbi:hypothetical protein [Gryllotalpicola sp.]|uniref:hypothetical protein n=1 Tax=Gryllotalpicola sp. TaxID=1932787 RepID=UPI0026131193|nr:hypothetical protein [Gryllotalpicola sp.]
MDPRRVGREDGSAGAALREVAQPVIPTDSESGPVVSEQRSSAPAEPASPAPEPFNPPTGHWSLALDDDPETTAETTSGAATSANSLIIDVIPSIADVTAPLTSTGEILVTGSIDLTRALGATGQIPSRFDGSAVDEFGDDDPAAVSTNDVVPVSAARAVSSHISVLPSVAPPKAQNPHLPAILGSTAGALAVVVAGILVSAFVFHVF